MVHEEEINDKFYLLAINGMEDMTIQIKDGEAIVPSCVYAIGYNEDYIIAKVHPYEFGYPLNKKMTNYYIIPAKGKGTYAQEIGVIGPLTFREFDKKKEELNIPKELTFTKVFKDLE